MLWRCMCDCGAEKVIRGADLRSGKTASCGCGYGDLVPPVHGDCRRGEVAPEYSSWSSMVQRCTNENSQGWEWYGARGIKVCERWRTSYANFISDMGRRPPGRSIERIDNDGNYEPGNCKWATAREQRMNQRRMKRCEFAQR